MCAPERHSNVAQRFSAGNQRKNDPVPEGRPDFPANLQSDRIAYFNPSTTYKSDRIRKQVYA